MAAARSRHDPAATCRALPPDASASSACGTCQSVPSPDHARNESVDAHERTRNCCWHSHGSTEPDAGLGRSVPASSCSTTRRGTTSRRPSRTARSSPRRTHSYADEREIPNTLAASSTVIVDRSICTSQVCSAPGGHRPAPTYARAASRTGSSAVRQPSRRLPRRSAASRSASGTKWL